MFAIGVLLPASGELVASIWCLMGGAGTLAPLMGGARLLAPTLGGGARHRNWTGPIAPQG